MQRAYLCTQVAGGIEQGIFDFQAQAANHYLKQSSSYNYCVTRLDEEAAMCDPTVAVSSNKF